VRERKEHRGCLEVSRNEKKIRKEEKALAYACEVIHGQTYSTNIYNLPCAKYHTKLEIQQ
jgi:hypothetical protein